jgi:poly-gamma-glutamate synthesis protein (capsule biosynthesis protein)
MSRHKYIKDNNKSKVIVLLITTIILILLNILISSYVINKMSTTVITDISKKDINIHKEFSFIAVGDALIHDGVYNDAKTNEKDESGYYKYDFKDMFTEIKEIIKDYDLKFYNQETIIGGKSIGLSSYPCFNSPDEVALDLLDAGFNIVNLATNHTLDRGENAILYSRNFWKNQENVLAVGSYDSYADHDEVIVKEQNGIKYAVLGYTTVTNGLKVPDGKDYLLNVYDEEKVKEDIEKVRDKVDVLIVSMHWGVEYTHTPISSQREIASYLSSLGVDVIIGHHPHVVEPIEFIDNTLVIYSLGNFISAQEGTSKRVGMIVAFDVYKDIKNGEKTVSVTNVKADLLWTYHNNYKNFKVIPFSHLKESELKNHDAIYEEYKKYISSDENVQIGFIE